MKITLALRAPKAECAFILVPEKDSKKAYGKRLDPEVLKEIEFLEKQAGFSHRGGEFLLLPSGIKGVGRTFVVGMGEIKKKKECRCLMACVIKKAHQLKLSSVVIVLPQEVELERAIGGAFAGNYQFKLGETKELHQVEEVVFVTEEKRDIKSDMVFGDSQEMTKDLINMPPNYIHPESVVSEVKALAKKVKGLKITIFGRRSLEKLKMGCLLGVAQGSNKEPQMIVLEYQGGLKKDAPIALVGKGVTFDSGGYNLKPTGSIEDMKCDMAGAATVIGMMKYFAETKVKKNIIGVVGLVENMVSSKAYKPGDVLTAMNGKTVEITNTDAEGRLLLADVLHYTTTHYKPVCIIDFATLTGACMAALGYTISGVMGNDQKLIDSLKRASEASDESIWQLPLNDYFVDKTKGNIADLVNWTDGVMAGASMAAAFLSQFVGETPWAHFDIAGSAFHGKYNSGGVKMASGVMMRTIRTWVEGV